MREIVTTDISKCEACNRCIRVCPVSEANIAYIDDGKIKVRVDPNKCIACGACIEACQHGARNYSDDTERFFADLRRGEKISVLTAPALRTNFDNAMSILAWLKKMGADKIIDVSLGADICTWAHIRYIEQNNPKAMITQPCPAIVNYITKYQSSLCSNLSPVHSPMLCTAIYMRKHLGVSGKIAALSPCIAKTHEFEDTGIVSYNVTFKKIAEYIQRHHIHIPNSPFKFDNIDASLGRIYAMPGGLKENVEYYIGKSVRVDKSEGQDTVYKDIDVLSKEPSSNRPAVFDVLNCADGCNLGTGCNHDTSVFKVNRIMNDARQHAMKKYQKSDHEKMTKLFAMFDKKLTLGHYTRTYKQRIQQAIPYREDAVERAFAALGKTDEVQRNHNCYACGSDTCREMAVRIAKGINIPENCMEKTRSDIMREHQAVISEQNSNLTHLNQILTEIDGLKKMFEKVHSSVDDVQEMIDQYSSMGKVISDIAMQTRILSLNAAVEAARAGASGKGFSVVAQAIRELADGSQQSVDAVADTGDYAKRTLNEITTASKTVDESILKVAAYIQEIAEKIDSRKRIN